MNNKKIREIAKYMFLLGIFLIVIGSSYALFSVALTGKKKTKITTAKFGITLTDINGNEEEDGIAVNLDKAVPEEDSEGVGREGYKFVVTNTGNVPASYELKLNSSGDLDTNYIKYNLIEKDYLKRSDNTYYMGGLYDNGYRYNVDTRTMNGPMKLSSLSNNILHKTTLLPGEKMEYELKIWVDEDATLEQASNKTYEASVVVEGHQAKEFITGKAGENVDYVLYSDGTLALTGEGAIRVREEIEGTNPKEYTYYNNGGGIYEDIIWQYANKNGYNFETATESSHIYYVMNILSDLITEGEISKSRLKNTGSEAIYYVTQNYFDGSRAEFDKFIDFIDAMEPHITRVVLDEGITSLGGKSDFDKSCNILTKTGDYMLTIPSTLINVMGWNCLSDYMGYTLVFSPNMTSFSTNFGFGQYLEYIDLSHIEHLNGGITLEAMHTLLLPNSIKSTSRSCVGTNYYSSGEYIVNIDNTEEFVNNNFYKDQYGYSWLNPYPYHENSTITVNYLR